MTGQGRPIKEMEKAILTLWGISAECPYCNRPLLLDPCVYAGESDIYPGDLVICQSCGDECLVGEEIDDSDFWNSKRHYNYSGPRLIDDKENRRQSNIRHWLLKLERMDEQGTRQYKDIFIDNLIKLDASPLQIARAQSL